ncbi:atrial natriuretic peptide receptor 1, partial [Biomphalaria pfeifferi]
PTNSLALFNPLQPTNSFALFNPLQPTITLSQYYDAVRIYGTVLAETIDKGGNPFDGLSITKQMWNRTFD